MWCGASTLEVDTVGKLSNTASVAAAVLFLLYLIVYSIACPRKELLLSVGCEILFFVCLAAWRLTRSKSLSSNAKNAVVAQLTDDSRPLARARMVYHCSWLAAWVVVCILGTLDFSALLLAFTGNLTASEYLYTNVPTMRVIGAHPAATAEILSGAYLNAGKFDQAEKIYGLIGNVRHSIYGPEGESSVGLLADYGDLYYLQKRYETAIPYFQKSIEMSKKGHGATGYGRPLTGLANCYRETAQFDKAEVAYKEALNMRLQLYGIHSDKVSATLKEYSRLLNKMGREKESTKLITRAAAIDSVQKKEDNNPLPTLIVMAVVFTISFFLFGRKGFFTKIVTERLKVKVSNAAVPQPADVKRLAVLYKYQGIE